MFVCTPAIDSQIYTHAQMEHILVCMLCTAGSQHMGLSLIITIRNTPQLLYPTEHIIHTCIMYRTIGTFQV